MMMNDDLRKIAHRTPRVDKQGRHWYWNEPTKRWRRDYDKDPKKIRPKDSAKKLKPKDSVKESKPKKTTKESKPKKGSTHPELRPKESGLELSPQSVRNAANEIKPARLSDRRNLLSQIRGWETTLSRLGAAANDAISEQKDLDIINDIAAQREKMRQRDIQQLERIYKGRLDRFDALLASSYKRLFEALNPNKRIRVPKGTTQVEYLEIVKKIAEGDKDAIAKYTVKAARRKRKKGKK